MTIKDWFGREKLVTMRLNCETRENFSLAGLQYILVLSSFIDNGFYSFDKKLEQHFQHAYYTSFARTV